MCWGGSARPAVPNPLRAPSARPPAMEPGPDGPAAPGPAAIREGWFRETCSLWPGQALSLQVEQLLHHRRSRYQDILVFRRYGPPRAGAAVRSSALGPALRPRVTIGTRQPRGPRDPPSPHTWLACHVSPRMPTPGPHGGHVHAQGGQGPNLPVSQDPRPRLSLPAVKPTATCWFWMASSSVLRGMSSPTRR